MERPAPFTVGGIRIGPVRGPREDGRWYWRARAPVGLERLYVWTGWGTPAEVAAAVADSHLRIKAPAPTVQKAVCSVYLMEQADQYKIGITDDPRRRTLVVATATGRPTALVGLVGLPTRRQAERLEAGLMAKLHAYRRLGEWFDRADVVRDTFLAVPGAEAIP